MKNQSANTHLNLRLTCVAAVLFACTPLHASADEKRISDGIAPGDSNSKWVVGGTAGVISNPFLNEDDGIAFIMPNVEYRGERLFVKDGQLGFNLIRTNGFGAGVVLTGTGSYLSDKDNYDDNEKLRGIKEREGTADAGIYLVHNSELGRLKITLLEEVTGEHSGHAMDVNYVFDIPVSDQWNINPMVGATWVSAAEVDHFFGVSASEANADRAAYEGKSATSFYTGVRGRFAITPHWDLTMNALYIKLGDGIADSSLIEHDDMFASAVGINYNF